MELPEPTKKISINKKEFLLFDIAKDAERVMKDGGLELKLSRSTKKSVHPIKTPPLTIHSYTAGNFLRNLNSKHSFKDVLKKKF